MRMAESCPLDVERQSQLGATVYILMGVCRLQPFKTLPILFSAISLTHLFESKWMSPICRIVTVRSSKEFEKGDRERDGQDL
jgi:hypothetical protein